MLPTLSQLAGAEAPAGDGLSMVPTLLGKGDQLQHDHLSWEFLEQGGRRAVLQGHWKGVRQNTDNTPDGPIELYDISKDIEEAYNIADQHLEVVAKLAAIMREAHSAP